MEKLVSLLRIYVLADDYAGYGNRYWGQHGLSLLIEIKRENVWKRILFDTATSHEPILHNLQIMKKDLDVDYIVLSHNHYDHTGGLLGILREMKKEVPVIAHPEIFKKAYAASQDLRYIGAPLGLEESAEKLGAIWTLSREPVQILPGVFTLGEIPLEEREKWERDSGDMYYLENGEIKEDYMVDETGLAMLTPEGLVVIGGCSHPGIVSMIKRASKMSGEGQLRAVIGGFHLINASTDRIQTTVNSFREIGVQEIYAGHCTGLQAECAFEKDFGNKFHKLHTGMLIEIGTL